MGTAQTNRITPGGKRHDWAYTGAVGFPDLGGQRSFFADSGSLPRSAPAPQKTIVHRAAPGKRNARCWPILLKNSAMQPNPPARGAVADVAPSWPSALLFNGAMIPRRATPDRGRSSTESADSGP